MPKLLSDILGWALTIIILSILATGFIIVIILGAAALLIFLLIATPYLAAYYAFSWTYSTVRGIFLN